MQPLDWNDLRFVLALDRTGTLTGAGRQTGVNETTVARRIRRAETRLGAPLFVRDSAGRYRATELGRAALALAARIETEMRGLAEVAGAARDGIAGTVRITAVPVLVNRVLVPAAKPFLDSHPHLRIELVPDSRNLSLSRREADIALRLARPETGGLALRARRIGELDYAVFGGDDAARRWILYDDALAHLPQARWLANVARDDACPLRVSDAETAQEAAAAGLGRCLLPVIAGAADRRLRRLAPPADAPALPLRDLWCLTLADDAASTAVAAAKDWLARLDWAAATR